MCFFFPLWQLHPLFGLSKKGGKVTRYRLVKIWPYTKFVKISSRLWAVDDRQHTKIIPKTFFLLRGPRKEYPYKLNKLALRVEILVNWLTRILAYLEKKNFYFKIWNSVFINRSHNGLIKDCPFMNEASTNFRLHKFLAPVIDLTSSHLNYRTHFRIV